jgi:hypothetical protein
VSDFAEVRLIAWMLENPGMVILYVLGVSLVFGFVSAEMLDGRPYARAVRSLVTRLRKMSFR